LFTISTYPLAHNSISSSLVLLLIFYSTFSLCCYGGLNSCKTLVSRRRHHS